MPNMSAPRHSASRYTNRVFALFFTTVVALETAYPAFSNSSKAYRTQARLVGQSATASPGSSWPITLSSCEKPCCTAAPSGRR